MNPYRWVEQLAAADPKRPFLVTEAGRTLCYAELDRQAARYAEVLAGLGVEPGDRVAVQVEKSVEAVCLYAACLRMGAVYVPINTANTVPEVAYFFQDAAPRVAVVRPADYAALGVVAEAAGVAHLLTLGVAGDGSLARLVSESGGAAVSAVALDAGALAAIVYTSGTTGRSKGAMLTYGNLGSNAATLAAFWRFTTTDVLLHALPLFHIHGLFVAINTVWASGSSLILMSNFDAETTVSLLGRSTVFMGVPTHFTRLLQRPELMPSAVTGVRLFVSGSAPLLPETHEQFRSRTGHVILERYGMTETLMNTSNPYDGERVPGSVGPPLPDVEVRVSGDAPGADSDGSAGESAGVGVLEIRGPNVFAGYWRAPEKTKAEFADDGWFRSGDLGRIDSRGYVYIIGRAKDLVITGGYNVYPREVEAEIDALEGVQESAVIGVPHPDFGEGVTAIVVLRRGATLTERDVAMALQARLARYKIPKAVRFVSELPRNTMGKVQKNVLRQMFADCYRV